MPQSTPNTQALKRWLDAHCAHATFSLAAEHLEMSERTLSRRLAEEGSSFRELLDSTRQRKALEKAGSVCTEGLALELGYAGRRPLLRAFKRWTGLSLWEWLAQEEQQRRPDIPRHHGQIEASLIIVQPESSDEDGRET